MIHSYSIARRKSDSNLMDVEILSIDTAAVVLTQNEHLEEWELLFRFCNFIVYINAQVGLHVTSIKYLSAVLRTH